MVSNLTFAGEEHYAELTRLGVEWVATSVDGPPSIHDRIRRTRGEAWSPFARTHASIRELKARRPELPVLVLSMHDEMLYAERAMRVGAGGYVMKHEPPDRLLEGLRTVLKDEPFVSRRLAASLLNAFVGGSPRPGERGGLELLSNRELQVLEGIGGGMSTRQLGQKHGISPKTVETYRSHIKRKLGLDNSNELIHAAVRWVESEAAGP